MFETLSTKSTTPLLVVFASGSLAGDTVPDVIFVALDDMVTALVYAVLDTRSAYAWAFA